MSNGSYIPHFDILEDPNGALAELYIRGRHSDGTSLSSDESHEMGDRLYSQIASSDWFTRYGKIIVDEARANGQI